jgi:hypothetical protein
MSNLPPPLNLIFDKYESEMQQYKKLHRLVDVFEGLLKYLSIIAIQDFYRCRLNSKFPDVDTRICLHIGRPYLGYWQSFLEDVLSCFGNYQEFLFSKEIYSFYFHNFGHTTKVTPQARNISRLIQLRNILGHGATLSEEEAHFKILEYEPLLMELLEESGFLSKYPLVYVEDSIYPDGFKIRKFQPSRQIEFRRETTTAKDLVLFHVYIYNKATQTYLDLSPLLTYQQCREYIPSHNYRQDKLIQSEACGEYKFLYFNGKYDESQIDYLDYWRGHHSRVEGNFVKEFKNRYPKPTRGDGEWFDDLIHNKVENFVGREIERTALSNFVLDSRKSVFVLLGQPGIGKTTLLAQWSNENQYPRHFFREGDADSLDLVWFYDNLGRQIATQAALQWNTPKEAELGFHRRAFYSISKLATEKKGPLVIVLDGLDELVRAHKDGESVIRELPDLSNLPKKLRLVLSTRPELINNQAFERKYGQTLIQHQKMQPMSENDARALLYRGYSKYEVLDRPDYVQAIVQKSEGNPLYLKFLLDNIVENRLEFGEIDKLPEGIRNYYERLLEDFKTPTQNIEAQLKIASVMLDDLVKEGTWTRQQKDAKLKQQREELQKTHVDWLLISQALAILCIARQPVAKQLVSEILDVPIDTIANAFRVIRSVLIETEEVTFAIFHSGFREFLLSEDPEIVPDQSHRIRLFPFVRHKLIAWCQDWQRHGNTYALKHLIAHLAEDPDKIDDIYTLAANPDFLKMQRDVEIALPVRTLENALSWAINQEKIPQIIKLSLELADLIDLTRKQNPLDILSNAGLEQALRVADLYDPNELFIWYLLIAHELMVNGAPDSATKVLEQLQQKQILYPVIYDKIYKDFHRLTENLLGLLGPDTVQILWAITGSSDFRIVRHLTLNGMISEAIRLAREMVNPVERTDALTWIAVEQVVFGQPSDALETVMLIDQESRGEAWRDVFAFQLIIDRLAATNKSFGDEDAYDAYHNIAIRLADVGDYQAPLAIIRRCVPQDKIDDFLLDVTLAFGNKRGLSELFTFVGRMRNDGIRENVFCAIAKAEAKMGLFSNAISTLVHAQRFYGYHVVDIAHPAWRYILEQYYDSTEMSDAKSLDPKDEDYVSYELFPRWAFSLVKKVLSGKLDECLEELNKMDISGPGSAEKVFNNPQHYCRVLIHLYCDSFGFSEKVEAQLEALSAAFANFQDDINRCLKYYRESTHSSTSKTENFDNVQEENSTSVMYPSLISEASKKYLDSESTKQKDQLFLSVVERLAKNGKFADANTFFELITPGNEYHNKAAYILIGEQVRHGASESALIVAGNKRHWLEHLCRVLVANRHFEKAILVGEANSLYEENVCTFIWMAHAYLRNDHLTDARKMMEKATLNILKCENYYMDYLTDEQDLHSWILKWIPKNESTIEWILQEFASSIINFDKTLYTKLPNLTIGITLKKIGEYQQKQGWLDNAKVSVAGAIRFLELCSNSREKFQMILELAAQQIALGEHYRAQETLRRTRTFVEAFKESDDFYTGRNSREEVQQHYMEYIEQLLENSSLENSSDKVEVAYIDEDDDPEDYRSYSDELYEEIVNSAYSHQEILTKLAQWRETWVWNDDIDHDMNDDGLFMLGSLAAHFSKQGKDDLSVSIIELMGNEYHRSNGYSSIALHQIERGSFQKAFELAQKITMYRSKHLVQIAEAFVKFGSVEHFKKLIMPMGYQRATVYCCIRLMIDVYPDRFDDIVLTAFETMAEPIT